MIAKNRTTCRLVYHRFVVSSFFCGYLPYHSSHTRCYSWSSHAKLHIVLCQSANTKYFQIWVWNRKLPIFIQTTLHFKSSENHETSYCTQIMFVFWNANHLYFYIHVVHYGTIFDKDILTFCLSIYERYFGRITPSAEVSL